MTGSRQPEIADPVTANLFQQSTWPAQSKQSGLVMWVENDGLHWQSKHFHGIAESPLDAVVQALSFLQTVPATIEMNN